MSAQGSVAAEMLGEMQLAILQLKSNGYSDREIAGDLEISVRKVRELGAAIPSMLGVTTIGECNIKSI